MAVTATVVTSLTITASNVAKYISQPAQFSATIASFKGPSPGAILVSTSGTDVDLSQLASYGLCAIRNDDADNYVEFGIWDGATFFPLGELLPGECFIIRLSRNLGNEYGVGTGTTGPGINTWRFKANTAACIVVIEAFQR